MRLYVYGLAIVALGVLVWSQTRIYQRPVPFEDGEAGYIEVRGSDTIVHLGQAWAEAYMDAHPHALISVTGGGSGTGIAAIINGTAHIAESSRAITPFERALAEARGVDVREFIVARDALVIAVHRDNPVRRLTTEQLKDVFTGRIRHWGELGWEEGGPISVYSRQSNSGTYVYFNTTVMDGEDWAPGTRFLSGSASINEALRSDRSGIGYFGVGYADGVNVLEIARPGEPYTTPLDPSHVDSGLYPLARPLYFYTHGFPDGLTLDFLRFVLSEEGQALVREAGFYRITPADAAQNEAALQRPGGEEDAA